MGANKFHKATGLQDRFELVKNKYKSFVKDEILEKDEKPTFYIYRQTKNGHPFTGIICAVSVDDYLNGKIKIHEQTLSKREETFTAYLDITDINAEPVLLMSQRSTELEQLFAQYTEHRAEYDFTTTNRDRHQLWCISEEQDVKKVEEIYNGIYALYIAVGHLRSSSSAHLCEKR
jgi:uncharacterized protein (DUF1015 family)